MDEFDPHPEIRKHLTENDEECWRETRYLAKWLSEESVIRWLIAKHVDLSLTDIKKSVQYIQALFIICGKKPPFPDKTATEEDLYAFLESTVPLFKELEAEAIEEWTKDKWKK